MPDPVRPLKVFLCHAHSDKDAVKALYDRLVRDGVDAWLDKEKLLPGQSWRNEIQKAVRGADVVVVCHSKAFNREGFRQREVKWALDTALEKPEGEIFIIPARLDECEVPGSLGEWQWVDLFEENGYEMLMKALRARAESIGVTLQVKDAADHVRVEEPGVRNKGAARPYKLRGESVGLLIGAVVTILGALLGWTAIRTWFSQPPRSMATGTIPAQVSQDKPAFPGQATETLTPPATVVPAELTDPAGVEMVLVAAGEFTMGSEDLSSDELPPHTVFLDSYYIDKYEVTNALYQLCVDRGPCDAPVDLVKYNDPQYAEHPVVYVDWYKATEYCEWRDARLPTEAEWEKAARGTGEHTYPWGNAIDCTYANYQGCVGDTTPVGSYARGRSPYGAYDMAGNVLEWVADWYGVHYYASSTREDPPGPESGDSRVLRGGSWYSKANSLRSANRYWYFPSAPNARFGFRCARPPWF